MSYDTDECVMSYVHVTQMNVICHMSYVNEYVHGMSYVICAFFECVMSYVHVTQMNALCHMSYVHMCIYVRVTQMNVLCHMSYVHSYVNVVTFVSLAASVRHI